MPNEKNDSSEQQNQQTQQQEKDSANQEHPSRDTDTNIDSFRRSRDSLKK